MTNTTSPAAKTMDQALHLGRTTTVPDGTYFGVARWDAAARDYVDVPGLYRSEMDARETGDGGAMGSRLVRWTVRGGAVTTRRGLR